ncbi:MAG TPA: acetyl-CoA carboxylase carboxyltransferase subunit alpha [Gammaproteobacteria bacterium]|jgi:acetyl-CoA carboxylase carboxyl transferase subunit alpha|nr:acetyl-CoA carboxylase carboxyltransferase subunit alpha [Gammaproteobacteria bacterium]|tara:strand:- start:190 stop:1149 length:960 start_codon:yes stop_codon:yes gene_type:complete
MDFLNFEQPIVELERRIEELKLSVTDSEYSEDIDKEINKLSQKCEALTNKIFSNLTEWQIVQLSRHPNRPKSSDVIKAITPDFQELHGDRMYADDTAIISGLGTIDNLSMMLIAQEKGKDTKSRVYRNYGMPRPEGYRKALRVMKLAEKFSIPIVTIIDTPGAYPGIGAEERGQSEAIAKNLFTLASIRTPVINLVLGEGGSGGALAIGMGDSLMMLQYSVYTVISPEACSSILWRNPEETEIAADSMGLSAKRLSKLGVVDQVIKEPLGGFHRDPEPMYQQITKAIVDEVSLLSNMNMSDLLERRRVKFRAIGQFKEI